MRESDCGAYIKIRDKFIKMEGFFKFDISSVPELYERRYIEDDFNSISVSKSKTKILYAFDRMKNSPVHDFLARVSDFNLKGNDAETEIILVDFTSKNNEECLGILKRFAILSKDTRPEDGFLDYSGIMLSVSDAKEVVVKSADDFKTIEFFEKRRGILCDLNS